MTTDTDLLTVPEAAERYRLHRDTLYSWIRNGVIGHVRVGPPGGGRRVIRIRENELAETVTAEDVRQGRAT